MAALKKEDIIKAKDSILTEVEVAEWGGSVFIGGMGLGDLIDFYDKNYTKDGEKETSEVSNTLDILLKTLKDENGIRLFADDEKDILSNKDSVVLLRLFKKCTEVIPMLNNSDKDVKKNLQEMQQDCSRLD